VLRVVLDTNVLVRAIISDGKPRELLRRGISKQVSIVTSELILKRTNVSRINLVVVQSKTERTTTT